MTPSKEIELVNTLIEIEEQISELWDYHPDNPKCIDVVSEFDNLQKNALSISHELAEMNITDSDMDVV